MKRLVIISIVVMIFTVNLFGQNLHENQIILVKFDINGKTVSCSNLNVEIKIDGHLVPHKSLPHGFIVPATINQLNDPNNTNKKNNVDVNIICDKYTLNFTGLYPSWISPGHWETGIAYPPFWFEILGYQFRRNPVIEKGTWFSYLVSECNDCDPGVVTAFSHSNPPLSLIKHLRQEQPNASGKRARDIAYSLAVFNIEKKRNSDYLINLMNTCLANPKDSSEDDICDNILLEFITNLYWRGDERLLDPLLQLSDSRKGFINEVGTFYGDLLDRKPINAVQGLRHISVDKQIAVCKMAGEDNFSIDGPQLDRVVKQLDSLGNDIAENCLKVAMKAANRKEK